MIKQYGLGINNFSFRTFGFGTAIWEPVTLFAGGKQGALYDPSDLTTLFQDAAGTVPVTKSGDPVGLMLDKSQGLALGANVLPNSDFSNGLTGWRVGFPESVSATMVNNKCVLEHIAQVKGAAIGLEPTLTFEVGKTYKLTVDMEHVGTPLYTAGIYNFQDGANSSVVANGRGNATIIFTAKTSGIKFRFGFNIDSTTLPLGSKLIIHSIKAHSISGNHAVQTLSASRPTYQTDGTKSWLYNDKVDDKLLVTLPAMTATVITATDDGVTINYPVSIAAGSRDITSTSTLGRDFGRLIIDRELTAAEKTQVTTYFNAKRGVTL